MPKTDVIIRRRHIGYTTCWHWSHRQGHRVVTGCSDIYWLGVFRTKHYYRCYCIRRDTENISSPMKPSLLVRRGRCLIIGRFHVHKQFGGKPNQPSSQEDEGEEKNSPERRKKQEELKTKTGAFWALFVSCRRFCGLSEKCAVYLKCWVTWQRQALWIRERNYFSVSEWVCAYVRGVKEWFFFFKR